MKNIFIGLFLVLALFSCTEDNEKGYIEETGDILEGYVDTLEGSIGGAKQVRDLMNSQQDTLKEDLEALK